MVPHMPIDQQEAACDAFLEPDGLGYVRSMTPSQARLVAPQLPEIDDDTQLWALFDGNGELLLLTDNRSSTFFKAAEDEISLRTVH